MKRTTDLRARRTQRDWQTAVVAILVLAAAGAAGWWMSRDTRKAKEAVLATVPAFPTKDQEPTHPRRPPDPAQPTPGPTAAPEKPKGPKAPDALTRLALYPSSTVALVEWNAVVNTPFFQRIQECYPAEFSFTDNKAPFDPTRDIDRVAMTDSGIVMSGFFGDKPLADSVPSRDRPDAVRRDYRGWSVLEMKDWAMAQNGSLMTMGDRSSINTMIDHLIDPPPADSDPSAVYGDVYLRSDLAKLKSASGQKGGNDMIDSILQRLDGVTVRANIWDSVALSIDGVPRNGQSVEGLASVIRGGLALGRTQIDSDDVKLSALAELANVGTDDKQIKVNLAVPVNDLFEKFHFPCPAKDPRPPVAEEEDDDDNEANVAGVPDDGE